MFLFFFRYASRCFAMNTVRMFEYLQGSITIEVQNMIHGGMITRSTSYPLIKNVITIQIGTLK